MTFLISARSNGDRTWLRQGDALSVEFPDGMGVSGRIADVSIAPGGLPFSLIVTDDGQWPETSPLGDMIALVQSHGYVVQEQDDYDAGLRIEHERGMAHAASQSTCDEAAGEPGDDMPEGSVAELSDELRRTRIELELSRERVVELSQKMHHVVQDMAEVADARDYWRRKAHSRLMGVDTIVVNVTNPRD